MVIANLKTIFNSLIYGHRRFQTDAAPNFNHEKANREKLIVII